MNKTKKTMTERVRWSANTNINIESANTRQIGYLTIDKTRKMKIKKIVCDVVTEYLSGLKNCLNFNVHESFYNYVSLTFSFFGKSTCSYLYEKDKDKIYEFNPPQRLEHKNKEGKVMSVDLINTEISFCHSGFYTIIKCDDGGKYMYIIIDSNETVETLIKFMKKLGFKSTEYCDAFDNPINYLDKISSLKRKDMYVTIKKYIPIKNVIDGPVKIVKRKSIPKKIKVMVWDKYIGKIHGVAKCYCCNSKDIEQLEFHCGHVISVKDGGSDDIDNLRPICAGCNLSMGSENMNEFQKRIMGAKTLVL